MLRRGLIFLSVLFALPVVHCASSEDTATISREDFVSQYCELSASCCPAAGYSGNACTRELESKVPANFDAVNGRTCLDAIRAAAGGETFCSKSLLLAYVPACQLLSDRGTVPIGGACHDAVTGVDCAPSPEGPVACVYGGRFMCQLQALGTEGATCVSDSNEDGTLPKGAYLEVQATDRGTYCDRSHNLYCDRATNVCTLRKPIGSACCGGPTSLRTGTCLTNGCIADAYCDSNSGLCTTVAPNGAPCSAGVQCQSSYCNGATKRCSNEAPPGIALLCDG